MKIINVSPNQVIDFCELEELAPDSKYKLQRVQPRWFSNDQ